MKKILTSVLTFALVALITVSLLSISSFAADSPVRPEADNKTALIPFVIWREGDDGNQVLRFVLKEGKDTTIKDVEKKLIMLNEPSADANLTEKQLQIFADAYAAARGETSRKVLYTFWIGFTDAELYGYFIDEELQEYCPFYDEIEDAVEAFLAKQDEDFEQGLFELPLEIASLKEGDSVDVYVNEKQLPMDYIKVEDGKLTLYLPSLGAISIFLAK